MNDKHYRILGKVIDRKTRIGIAGLRIEAWDKDLICSDLLGSAVTDGQGAFEIAFSESYFWELFLDRRPDIFFKVFRNNELVQTTEDSVLWNIAAEEIPVVIEGDLPVEQQPKPFVVRGQIRYADGKPFVGARVRAFDKDLRQEAVLGEATTDPQGHYEIAYASDQFARADKQRANLLVRVLDAADQPLASSPLRFNAGPTETIDLELPAAAPSLSEYEELLANLTPALVGVAPAELTDEDIAFLAGTLGKPGNLLAAVRDAAHLAREAGLPVEAYYGLIRAGIPSDLSSLLASGPKAQRWALQEAVAQARVPAAALGDIDALVAQLQAARITEVLARTGTPGRPSFSELLDTAAHPVPADLRKAFVTACCEYEGEPEAFWEGLHQRPEFKAQPGLVDDLRLTLQLGSVTGGHLPMVRELQALRSTGKLPSLPHLARLTSEDWLALINKPSGECTVGTPPGTVGEDDTARTHAYAEALAQRIADAFPTAAVAAAAERAKQPDETDLVTFFSRTVFHDAAAPARLPDFDLAKTHVDRYLRENPDAAAEIPNPTSFAQQLKSMQRVFKITPHYTEMRVLLADGLHSAHSILRMGPGTFSRRYADQLGGRTRAEQIYDGADRIQATVSAIVGNYAGVYDGGGTAVTPKPAMPPADEIADWPTLFGSLSFCTCEHCRSVYGPAAYLVDLLSFLRDEIKVDSNKSAKDVLFDRRPDIGHIELSCANTNTPLPYIDLVNEILENTVAPPPVTVLWPQTQATAAELSVEPENVNPNAYSVLRDQVYPWRLPFDRWTEESRAYLERLGTSRHELQETFYSVADPPALTREAVLNDEDIAREYLGLTQKEWAIITDQTKEWAIITGQAPESPWQFWGYPSGAAPANWLSEVAQIPELLKRSGLTYAELSDLLATHYINPVGELSVAPPASCKLEEMILEPASAVDSETLTRIVRFVRLQRKLDWSAYDLDRAIVALRPSETLITQLSHVERLRAALRLPVVKLLSFWSAIDTAGYQVPGKPLDKSLYDRLFQNLAVVPNEELGAFNLPAVETQTVGAHIPVLLAVLGISESDLRQLLVALGLNELSPLTLVNLSALYRHAVLAKALKLSVADLLAVLALTGIDPFARTGKTLIFVEKVKALRASHFSATQLDYLYRHNDPAGKLVPSPVALNALAATLVAGLNRITNETSPVAPTPDALAKELGKVLDAQTAAAASAFVEGVPEDGPGQPDLVNLYFGSFLPVPDYTKLLAPKAPNQLTDAQSVDFRNAAIAYLLEHLRIYLKDTLERDLIEKALGETLKLDKSITEALLEHLLKSRADPAQPALADFRALAGTGWQAQYAGTGYDPDDGHPVEIMTEQTDPTVDFTWASGAPAEGIDPAQGYTVVWRGVLLPPRSETYTFEVRAIGDVKLWLNNQPVQLQTKLSGGAQEFSVAVDLTAGQLCDIRLEYTAGAGNGLVQLRWSSPSTPRAIVPQAQIYPQPAVYIHFSQAFTLLHKAALLVNGFKMTAKELAYLSAHGEDFAGVDPATPDDETKAVPFDLNRLPLVLLDPVDYQPAFFAGWERLRDFFALRDALPAAEVGLTDVFALAADLAADPARLAAATGWDAAELAGLTAADLHDETALIRLRDQLDLARRTDVPTAKLRDWSQPKRDAGKAQEEARAIRAAWKAKYDDEGWAVAAKPLSDALREQRRTALADYLVASWGVKDTNALYNILLIDVEMSAVAMTSRIKQAISSVQLFVQRCLLGLEKDMAPGQVEKDIALDEDAAREWKWRKNYRVWEANRKVFLYPENWIEPELRDDKTPFFRELETELLQGDITVETAETAYLNYLYKLDAVAKLEICGMFHQVSMSGLGPKGELTEKSWPEVNVLHVFARTGGTEPRTYYYRRRVDDMYWTPWEKVGVDIQGDHLLPVVYRGRLRLFWPIFKEKSEKPSQPSSQTPTPLPLEFWEIKLAWSEYQDGKWSPKKMSETSISTFPNFFDRRQYTFTADYSHVVNRQGELCIFCWEKIKDLTTSKEAAYTMRLGYFLFVDWCHDLIHSNGLFFLSSDEIWRIFWDHLLPPPLGGDYYIYHPQSKPQLVTEYETLHQYQHFIEGKQNQLQFRGFTSGLLPSYAYTLANTPGQFRVLFPKMYGDLEKLEQDWLDRLNGQYPGSMPSRQAFTPFFFQDDQRAFFVAPQVAFQPRINVSSIQSTASPPFALWQRFQTFYHPYVCTFIEQLNRYGLDGLLDPPNQGLALRRQLTHSDYFFGVYWPNEEIVAKPYPVNYIDFSPDGAYSQYNWELFFHIPLLIAVRLMQNQRFDEARQWFHYIFDPTLGYDSNTDLDDCQQAASWWNAVFSPNPPINYSNLAQSDITVLRRFWKTQPFYFNCLDQVSMECFMWLLSDKGNAATQWVRSGLELQIELWRRNPFSPHLLARLRITPYQKTVVMKYIDNLIAWGDQLFRRETLESINEATQLYILAAEILGPRPVEIPPRATAPVQTYNDLEPDLDQFKNALVQVENLLPMAPQSMYGQSKAEGHGSLPKVLYFCVPNNPELLARWDTVADRLFKIRHGMNIEGVFRELALFEPPINPALLIKAAAAGLDIGSVLADLSAPLPYYRFATLVQRALDLCNDVQALGNALLSALEKRDAEALAAIRATQESEVLGTMKLVKEAQINEAQATKDALDKTMALATARKTHYENLLSQSASARIGVIEIDIPMGIPLNSQEATSLLLDAGAIAATAGLAAGEGGVALSYAAPDEEAGTSGNGGHAVTSTGGSSAGNAESAGVRIIRDIVSIGSMGARVADKVASLVRRQEDWKFQKGLAELEEQQVQAQIDAADKRITTLERERDVNDKQQEHADSIKDYLQGKFTNTDLYGWMIGQVAEVYFKSYKLAYGIAKQAERCYRFELGLDDSDFIQFGYWDGLHKGLLAGEKLRHDLRCLELAYAEKNRREYEITKHVSLLLLNPAALIGLRETGTCEFDLPEALFDLDFPGHYFRRIKSVSITIPCVVGPYTGINCTLRLLRNSLRKKDTLTDNKYARIWEGDDLRFADSLVPMQAIAASSAQNDSGLFELNFHDERYLPFEGAGAISRWRVELPREFRQFDYETITDVVLHLKYTAREGGQRLGDQALKEMRDAGNLLLEYGKEQGKEQGGGLYRLFSARQEFPDAWHHFLNQPDTVESANLELDLGPARFPFLLRGRALQMQRVDFYLRLRDGTPKDGEETYAKLYEKNKLKVKLTAPNGPTPNDYLTIESDSTLATMPHNGTAIQAELSETVPWQLQANGCPYREAIVDLLLVCKYTAEQPSE